MYGDDDAAQVVTAKLDDDTSIRIELAKSGSPDGLESAGRRDLNLDGVLATVGRVGSAVMEKLRETAPTRAAVELSFGFAVEAGKLTALWVGGKAEASLTVTLEWAKDPAVTLEWAKDSVGVVSGGKKADVKGGSGV